MVLVKLVDADYSALAKEIGKILNQLNLKLVKESELQSMKLVLAKSVLKIGQRNIYNWYCVKNWYLDI